MSHSFNSYKVVKRLFLRYYFILLFGEHKTHSLMLNISTSSAESKLNFDFVLERLRFLTCITLRRIKNP